MPAKGLMMATTGRKFRWRSVNEGNDRAVFERHLSVNDQVGRHVESSDVSNAQPQDEKCTLEVTPSFSKASPGG